MNPEWSDVGGKDSFKWVRSGEKGEGLDTRRDLSRLGYLLYPQDHLRSVGALVSTASLLSSLVRDATVPSRRRFIGHCGPCTRSRGLITTSRHPTRPSTCEAVLP